MNKKFRYLWKKTPSDLRINLIMEWILRPHEFEKRYQDEILFQEDIKNWRR